MTNVLDNESEFVIGHYKDGTLLPNEGWRRFKLTHRITSFKRYIAAASVATVVLAASASLYYFYATNSNQATETIHLTPTNETQSTTENKIEKIEFYNAPLKEVVADIERVYVVSISNVPEEEVRVTISYEGTAQDVVETINELLNTNLVIISSIKE
ncbi:MAG: hypothetical protein K2N35_16415 [Muribaculaceae bacterium]|nr:hypothetical protein [Muribaculaceae bacterium]